MAASLRRLVTADGLTKEMCVSVYLYAKEVKRLYKASGALFLALYLKLKASSLQIAYGGDRRPHDRLPVPVSLTRSGFPRIIPSFLRRQRYKKDDKADMLVKIWLSLFNLSKIILLAKRVDFSTFASIVSPWKDPEKVVQAVNRVAETLPQFLGRYLPWVSQIPLDEGVTWEPTWKAIPNSPYLSQQLRVPTIESEL